MLDEIEEFLTGALRTADFDRSLATVLFTDIVGSTQAADQLDTAGDGFFATFDGPARAIR